MHSDTGATRDYQTSMERIGKALAVGSTLGGMLVLMVLIAAGQRSAAALLSGLVLGCLFAGVALAAVGGPIWLILHALGLRRGRYAALVTGVLGLGLYAGAAGYRTRLFALAPLDLHGWLLGLLYAGAQALAVALFAAGIGLAMWRMAYRPA